MAVNVGKALLDHAEDCDFHFVRQPPELLGNIQVDSDITALRESVHVPAKRGCKTGYVEQRGMQQMRDGAKFPPDLLHHRGVLGNGAGSQGIELIGLMLHDGKVHAERGEQLPYTVMQFPRNVPALFIANLLQPAGQFA